MLNNIWSVLFLGLILGVKHALDTDHVAAVSTMVAAHRNPLKAAGIGAFWGLGHTSTLFLTGLAVLIFKISIPVTAALVLEGCVGVMLIILGLTTLRNNRPGLHLHSHKHDKDLHLHAHDHESQNQSHAHKKSFFVGFIHGLAGSGALMLLVLSTIKSTIQGFLYILVFGAGSVGGMMAVSLLLGIPYFIAFKKFPKLISRFNQASGVISIIVGMGVIYETIYLWKLPV